MKYFALIWNGNGNIMISLSANKIPNAIITPNTPPDAPYVTVFGFPSTCAYASAIVTSAAPIADTPNSSENLRQPHVCSNCEPNIHSASMLPNQCQNAVCMNAYVTNCHTAPCVTADGCSTNQLIGGLNGSARSNSANT